MVACGLGGLPGGRLVPLASTMKVLILDEAAHEIAAGRLRADVRVPLRTIGLTGAGRPIVVRTLMPSRPLGAAGGSSTEP